MKIEVYQNNRSIKPVTAWTSSADMHNWLDMNKQIGTLCAKIKETGDKSHKQNLPAMMPMGTVGDLTRKKGNCQPTGLVMIDVDGVEDPQKAWSQMLGGAATLLELERLHIVLIHITPSYHGLRLLCHCHADGMEATIKRVGESLKLSDYGTIDPACKDLSRLSYLVPEDYILYEEGLFDEVPSVSIEAMRQYQSTGSTPKGSNVQTSVGEVDESDERHKDFLYNGVRVADIAAEYVAETGGNPAEGGRHHFYNNMIVLFRNLCDNNPEIVHAVLPTFGLPKEETWHQCVSLCSNNRTTKIDSKLYFWLKKKGLLAARIETTESAEETEEIPPMPTLPPIFRQYVNAAPADFKVPTVVALLPILGTLTSHVRSTYIDGSEQSTEFISLLFAPPSSGKSFIRRLSELLKNLKDRDALSNAREELYASTERRKGANEKGQEAPKVSVRIVKPLISIPELLTKMRFNQGHHMYIEAEELDTFAKGNKGAGGDKSDLWRVTWDNGFYGQYYKSVNTFKGEVQMYMNLLFTSTQDQIDRFFRNVEDGLVTRFSVCPIENQQYAKFTPWKAIPKQERIKVDNILHRLEMKNYKMPLLFKTEDLLDVSDEDFDKIVPWQYEFQPFEHISCDYVFPTITAWLEEERIKAASTLNEARDVFRRRAALKGFRLAMLCHALYTNVGKREQKVICDFVRWFCTVDLRNSLYQFGAKYNELQQQAAKTNVPHNALFEKMSDKFTRDELRVALQRAFIKTPVKKVLSLWRRNKLIEDIGESEYTKTKTKKQK